MQPMPCAMGRKPGGSKNSSRLSRIAICLFMHKFDETVLGASNITKQRDLILEVHNTTQ